MSTEILRLTHFSCTIGHVQHFTDLSFSVRRGEIYGLMGLSAEQRDVLVSYFSGRRLPASGGLFLFGQPVRSASIRPYIACVHQGSSLVSCMTVAENLLVLTPIRDKTAIIGRKTLDFRCQELLEQYGLQIESDTLVGNLSAFGKTVIELMKAIVAGARIIFYDHGLEDLSRRDFLQLQRILQTLCAKGISVILLSGQSSRMVSTSQRISVIKDGVSIKTFHSADTTIAELQRVALGTSESVARSPKPSLAQYPLLQVRGMRIKKEDSPIDLTLQQGEIVCVAGYEASRTDMILQALYGLIPYSCYHLSLNNCIIPTESVQQSFTHGMMLIEHIERPDLFFTKSSVRDSVLLPLLQLSAHKGGLLRRRFLNAEVEAAAERAGLSKQQLGQPLTPDLVLRVHQARILLSHRSVLLLQNPFAALSPADTQTLRRFLEDYISAGNCVLFTSTHFSEVSEFCTRSYYLTEDGILLEQQDVRKECKRVKD